jgi:hypothetical protein
MKYGLSSIPEEEEALLTNKGFDEGRGLGAIGHASIDFGDRPSKTSFSTCFNWRTRPNTHMFEIEFKRVIGFLRKDAESAPLASCDAMRRFCLQRADLLLAGQNEASGNYGFIIRTSLFSYYFRCRPTTPDCDAYVFCYCNRYLLPVLKKNRNEP